MKSTASRSPSIKNDRKDPYVYFQPGEMIYVIKHENSALPRSQIQNLFRWSNRLADDLGLLVIPAKEPPRDEGLAEKEDPADDQEGKESEEVEVLKDKRIQEKLKKLKVQEHRRPRVYSFSPKPESNLRFKKQMQPKEGVKYKSPQLQMPAPFTLISADIIDPDAPEAFVENSKLASFVMSLEQNLQGLAKNPVKPSLGSGVSLEAVTLNWLMGASSESGGTGGPGGRPVPFTYETGQTPLIGGREVMDYPFEVLQNSETQVQLPPKRERGRGVKVAILDTAPSLHELAAAYERWEKVNPALNCAVRHELISSLLKPNGPLIVHPASYDDLLRMRSVHLHEHNYKMTDHGLFVAGIIHSLAPAAEIHLYEVLNADGVGDLESIAKGLWEVFEQFGGEPLVVNCSLVLNIPLDGHQITELDPSILKEIVKDWEGDTNYDYLNTSVEGRAWLERQSQAIKWICDLLYSHGSRVIAAAGNDGRENQNRPNARFPAAFDSVVGVGALPKNTISTVMGGGKYNTAGYSNISDKPEEIGVTTLGGEAGEKMGVLGLYIGEFPVDPNPSWWRRFLNWVIVLLGGRVAGPRNLTDMAWWSGTSFATPILAGTIAALLGSIQPARTEDAIVEAYNNQIVMEDQTVNHEDALNAIQA